MYTYAIKQFPHQFGTHTVVEFQKDGKTVEEFSASQVLDPSFHRVFWMANYDRKDYIAAFAVASDELKDVYGLN